VGASWTARGLMGRGTSRMRSQRGHGRLGIELVDAELGLGCVTEPFRQPMTSLSSVIETHVFSLRGFGRRNETSSHDLNFYSASKAT